MQSFKKLRIPRVRRSLAWQAGGLATLGALAALTVQAVWQRGYAPAAQTPFITWNFAWSLVLALIVGLGVHYLVLRGMLPMRRLVAKGHRVGIADLPPQKCVPTDFIPWVDALCAVLARHEKALELARSIYADLNHDLRTPLHNLTVQTEVTLMAHRSVEEYEVLLRSNLEEFMRLATVADRTLRALRELASQPDPS